MTNHVTILDAIHPNAEAFSANYAGESDPASGKPAGLPFRTASRELRQYHYNTCASPIDYPLRLDSTQLFYREEVGQVVLRGRGDNVGQLGFGGLRLRERGLRQLCREVGAPFEYVARLPIDYALRDLNWSLSKASQRVQLRTGYGYHQRGKVSRFLRGVVGPRYSAFDLPDLLRVIDDALEAKGLADDAAVMEAHVGATTRLWITLSPQMKGADGYPTTAGIKVRNGEIGNSSVRVDPGFLTVRCANGLIHYNERRGASRRHSGKGNDLSNWLAVEMPRLFEEANTLTAAVNTEGAKAVSLADAERRLAGTELSKAARSRVIRLAIAEAEERAAYSGEWFRRPVRAERLSPVDVDVYEELKERGAWAANLLAADIMNGMTEVAKDFDAHKRSRIERAAHGVIFDSIATA